MTIDLKLAPQKEYEIYVKCNSFKSIDEDKYWLTRILEAAIFKPVFNIQVIRIRKKKKRGPRT